MAAFGLISRQRYAAITARLIVALTPSPAPSAPSIWPRSPWPLPLPDSPSPTACGLPCGGRVQALDRTWRGVLPCHSKQPPHGRTGSGDESHQTACEERDEILGRVAVFVLERVRRGLGALVVVAGLLTHAATPLCSRSALTCSCNAAIWRSLLRKLRSNP